MLDIEASDLTSIAIEIVDDSINAGHLDATHRNDIIGALLLRHS